MTNLEDALRVYLVADPDQCPGDVMETVRAALDGGVTAVQLRAKTLTDREAAHLGRRLLALTRGYGAPLLINDRVDVALAIGAEGVHLGVHDLAPADVRRIAPESLLLGYSPDDPGDTAGEAADYLGIGPIYGTTSKPDAGIALGIDTFRSRVAGSNVPVVGIGGVQPGNAAAVVEAGAAGVAVISAILGAEDPKAAAGQIRQAVESAR